MALVLELNTTVVAIAKALEADVLVALQLENAGVTVSTHSKFLVFLYGGSVIATAGLSLGPLKTVLAGKGSPSTKAIMKGPFEAAMQKAVGSLEAIYPVANASPNPSPVSPGLTVGEVMSTALGSSLVLEGVKEAYFANGRIAAIKKLRTLKPLLSLKDAINLVDEWEISYGWKAEREKLKVKPEPLSLEKEQDGVVKNEVNIMDTAPVQLAAATALYQPVRGTGGTSKYFVVALGKELNVAVRIKPDLNISFRVEGDTAKYKDRLLEAGLDNGGPGHYSFHVKVENKLMMRQLIAAKRAALGYPFDQVTDSFDKLIGAGS